MTRTAKAPEQELNRVNDLSQRVHTAIRRRVLAGTYPPGTEMKQANIAQEFQVSRGPVREAFRRLEEEGLLDSAFNLRSTVTKLNAADIAVVYGARIAMESYAIAITTGTLTPSMLGRARSALDGMFLAGGAGDLEGWNEAHFEFHGSLTASVGGVVAKTLDSYRRRCDRYVNFYHGARPDAPLERMHEHVDLLESVQGTDGDASARLLAEHLATTVSELLHVTDRQHDLPIVEQAVRMATSSLEQESINEL